MKLFKKSEYFMISLWLLRRMKMDQNQMLNSDQQSIPASELV
jgi:hypothetical protein